MKKEIMLVVLLVVAACVASGCIATAVPSGDITEVDHKSFTKTYTTTGDGVVIALSTDEVTKTAVAYAEYSEAKSFENDNMFRVAVSITVAALQDPEDANDKIAILSKTMNMPLESPIKSTEFESLVNQYEVQSVTVSGYVNGEKVEVTYNE